MLGGEQFRWHFGPMFYRGRLTDGDVKVLVIGQEGAQDESLGHRSFVGGTGAQLGIHDLTTTFYIEAVNPSQAIADHSITVHVHGGGLPTDSDMTDTVRVTTTMVLRPTCSGRHTAST